MKKIIWIIFCILLFGGIFVFAILLNAQNSALEEKVISKKVVEETLPKTETKPKADTQPSKTPSGEDNRLKKSIDNLKLN